MAESGTHISAAIVSELASLMRGRTTIALSGAGVSTGSGIPDYRGPSGVLLKRQPMTFQEFSRSQTARRRYWARSTVGWPAVHQARPNASHRALADLEQAGVVTGLITQNVDGLHQKAGSINVLELHGSLAGVVCLNCGNNMDRLHLQDQLVAANPHLPEAVTAINPDGDAELDDDKINRLEIPGCPRCGGVLKPDVVYFGESVPKSRIRKAFNMVDQADVLLVVGSSLTVFSGYRFAVHADAAGKPVAIVNRGTTRADDLATLKINGEAGQVMGATAGILLGQAGSYGSSVTDAASNRIAGSTSSPSSARTS